MLNWRCEDGFGLLKKTPQYWNNNWSITNSAGDKGTTGLNTEEKKTSKETSKEMVPSFLVYLSLSLIFLCSQTHTPLKFKAHDKEMENLNHWISNAFIITHCNSLGFCHNKGTCLQRQRELSVRRILIHGKKIIKK